MTASNSRRRLVVGISGASGAIYGIRLLEMLRNTGDVDVHLVVTATARMNVRLETDWSLADLEALATEVHDYRDLAANISSGSFRTMGMIVAPCSMKTLSGIANSSSDNLLTRAADVVLKEQRRLVLMVRETPLHLGHCKLLVEAASLGAIIAPPIPAFYNRPVTLNDIIDHSVGRVLDLFGIDVPAMKRWQGVRSPEPMSHATRPRS